MPPKYEIVVDSGVPYSIYCTTDGKLRRELMKLKMQAHSEDNPYFDVWVYDSKGKDITDKVFKKYKFNR